METRSNTTTREFLDMEGLVSSSQPHRTSIVDVAREAGVSPTTVSHVLSGKRPVSAETERRVRATVEKLGYVPSHAAQSLRTGSMHTVGVLVPDITNHFFARVLAGVEDAASQFGFSTVMSSSRFDPDRELRHLTMMVDRGVDALVYAAGAPPSSSFLRDVAKRIPIALVDEPIDTVPTIVVIADNHAGGRLLGDHLWDLGHVSALVVTGPSSLPGAWERVTGFTETFHGTTLIVEGDFLESSGALTVREHPPDGDQPYTAVFALNDLMAMGAMTALRDQGWRIPDDVSVVGFDDIDVSAALNPPLTTVRQPPYDIGMMAATKLLQDVVEGRRPGSSTHILDVALKIRKSTAPPR